MTQCDCSGRESVQGLEPFPLSRIEESRDQVTQKLAALGGKAKDFAQSRPEVFVEESGYAVDGLAMDGRRLFGGSAGVVGGAPFDFTFRLDLSEAFEKPRRSGDARLGLSIEVDRPIPFSIDLKIRMIDSLRDPETGIVTDFSRFELEDIPDIGVLPGGIDPRTFWYGYWCITTRLQHCYYRCWPYFCFFTQGSRGILPARFLPYFHCQARCFISVIRWCVRTWVFVPSRRTFDIPDDFGLVRGDIDSLPPEPAQFT